MVEAITSGERWQHKTFDAEAPERKGNFGHDLSGGSKGRERFARLKVYIWLLLLLLFAGN